MREELVLTDSFKDTMLAMAEGNPGAINVMAQMYEKENDLALIHIMCLDDMNIRGCQIWLGYKDHCGEDIDKFIECIIKRDQAMVNTINANWKEEVAVVGKASIPGYR